MCKLPCHFDTQTRHKLNSSKSWLMVSLIVPLCQQNETILSLSSAPSKTSRNQLQNLFIEYFFYLKQKQTSTTGDRLSCNESTCFNHGTCEKPQLQRMWMQRKIFIHNARRLKKKFKESMQTKTQREKNEKRQAAHTIQITFHIPFPIFFLFKFHT